MKRTQPTHPYTRPGLRKSLIAATLSTALLASAPAWAEQVSIQFSQPYPGGGNVTGLLVGEDLDGDGRLYSMNSFVGGFIGQPPGDEVTYASVRIEGVQGQPVTIVFDDSVTDIEDPANAFFGFAYNLDGGPLGDDDNEGLAFAPLAPSTSYTVGALFAPAVSGSVIPELLESCGNEAGNPCSAVTTINPVDPFPNFELLFSATSTTPLATDNLLRYTFEQKGFENGASVTGSISGRDLDGDGRIYAVGQGNVDFIGLPPGDEVAYATVTIRGVTPEAIVNTVDLITGDILDFSNFFFGASVNVAGDQLGDEPGEGLTIAPFSPSTSYSVGDLFSPGFSPSVLEQGISNCGNTDDEPCAVLTTLTPNPDSPTGVDVVAAQYSAEPTSLQSAPLFVDAQFGGHWFNRVPSGEGIVIQKIHNGLMLMYWMTYDDAGNQRWILAIGERQGLQIVAEEVYVTDNGVFATLDPVEIDLTDVGDMVVEFSECDSGEVRYTIDGVSGTMEIGRLTGLGSRECTR